MLSIARSGPRLIKSDGTLFTGKGMGISGPEHNPVENGGIWPTGSLIGTGALTGSGTQTDPYTYAGDLTTIAQWQSWGITLVRIPVNSWAWLGNDHLAPGTTDYTHTPSGITLSAFQASWPGSAAYRTEIIRFMDVLAVHGGICSVLDDHWTDGTYMPGLQTAAHGGTNNAFCNGQTTASYSQVDVDFWYDAATRLKTRPYVVFELLCEAPTNYWWTAADTNHYNWVQGGGVYTALNNKTGETSPRTTTMIGCQTVMDTIRVTVGATNLIAVPGQNSQQDIVRWSSNSVPDPDRGYVAFTIPFISDTTGNYCPAVHWYPDSGVGGFSPNVRDNMINYSFTDGIAHNWDWPLFVFEFGPDAAEGPAATTTGTSTIPGDITCTSIPVAGNSPSAQGFPTGAQTAGMPDSALARQIHVAGNDYTYADIVGNSFKDCTGPAGTIATGQAVSPGSTQSYDTDRVGFVIGMTIWADLRNSASAGARGTQTGQRCIFLTLWNWNVPGLAGPEAIKSFSTAAPTNYGYWFENVFAGLTDPSSLLSTGFVPQVGRHPHFGIRPQGAPSGSVPVLPVGGYLYDAKVAGGNYEIFYQPPSGPVVQLTNIPTQDNWWPQINPADNFTVLYCSTPKGVHDNTPNAFINMTLRTIGLDGTGDQQVVGLPATVNATWTRYGHPAYSPDGTHVVVFLLASVYGLAQFNTSTGPPWLTDRLSYLSGAGNACTDPSFSSDGSKIVFVEVVSGIQAVSTVTATTATPSGHANLLVGSPTGFQFNDPYYSPDGTLISGLIQTAAIDGLHPAGQWADWLINSDGSNYHYIINDGNVNSKGNWMNNQSEIFHRLTYAQGGGFKLWTINVDGTGLTNLNVAGEYPCSILG